MLTAVADRFGSHPKRTLLAVLVFALLAGVFGGPVAGALRTSGGFTPADADSVRSVERIEQATGQGASAGVVLLVDTPGGADTAAAQRRVAALASALAAEPGIANVVSAERGGAAAFTATDGRSTYVAGTLEASADEEAVATAVTERFGAASDVAIGGSVIANQQVSETVSEDLARAEMLAFPVLLILSLLFFRGGRAALLPLAIGLTTILGTFLGLAAVNQAYGLSIFALNLVIGLGLGLAIDYALFLLTRFREELAIRGPGLESIRITMVTAGRTVVYSAATVASAMITLTLFPLNFLQSMGIAGAVVALVAAAASLVIAPALFALWGTKLATRPERRAMRAAAATDAPPAPQPGRIATDPVTTGRWYRLSKAVMRRPGIVAVGTGLLMVALAFPALRAEFTPVDATAIPVEQSARTVADTLRTEYAGQNTSPAMVVVDAPRAAAGEVENYARELAGITGVAGVEPPRALNDDTWQIDVRAIGAPEGDAAQNVVETIRATAAPGSTLVGGAAAEFIDQQTGISDRLPLALAALALLTFVILWLMTGSVVLPVKAILMNVLTVGSALGVVTLVFQDGRFEDFLGYTSNGGVEPTDFLVAAALVFALSTDYGVFLIERIKEARIPGRSEREAVAIGLERTGAVVTAAAILMAVAIGAFVTSSISFIQQLGVATAAGVLIDAFIVRALLVPSLMGLLGHWNWWSPAPLAALHTRLVGGREPHTAAAPGAAPVPAELGSDGSERPVTVA